MIREIYQWVNIPWKPKSFGRSAKVELDLSNFATKADLKIATGVDTLKFASWLIKLKIWGW